MDFNVKRPSGFKMAPISVGAKFISGYAFKSQDFCDEGIPVIKIKNIQTKIVTVGDSQCVPPSIVTERLKKFELKSGDVLIAMTGQGSVGRVGRISTDKNIKMLMNQRVGRFITDEKKLNLDYLYYVISSELYENLLFDRASGSGQPNLSPENILSVEIPYPPYVEQLEIASVLNAFDRQITLLRETNATLEAIAQALFKSWFVDFDPVRAKQSGRQPDGMDEATAGLFPDSFEESEVGMVPRGWKVQPIGDVSTIVGGATPDTKTSTFWEPAVHCWTTPKDLSGIPSPILLDTERKLSDLGLAKIGSGLLPTGTLLLSSRAPIGYLALAQVPVAINQGYIAIPPGGSLPPIYLLFWCRENMEVIKGRANGSTFMEISKKAFRPIPAVIPQTEIINAYIDSAGVLIARLVENERQAQSLAALRDALLPRLISGQLRIADVDSAVEEAIA